MRVCFPQKEDYAYFIVKILWIQNQCMRNSICKHIAFQINRNINCNTFWHVAYENGVAGKPRQSRYGFSPQPVLSPVLIWWCRIIRRNRRLKKSLFDSKHLAGLSHRLKPASRSGGGKGHGGSFVGGKPGRWLVPSLCDLSLSWRARRKTFNSQS